jgi:hypothetical protein
MRGYETGGSGGVRNFHLGSLELSEILANRDIFGQFFFPRFPAAPKDVSYAFFAAWLAGSLPAAQLHRHG